LDAQRRSFTDGRTHVIRLSCLPSRRGALIMDESGNTLGARFRALHERGRAFVIPNPWDIGSARLLEHLGFEALATTSAGFAFTMGRPDHGVTRDEMLAHVASLVSSVSLPVSVDLAKGFGDAPEVVADTIRLTADAGAAGGSIEDSTGRRDEPQYALPLAVERIRAAAEAAPKGPAPFVLTARAENYLVGRPDLADTIRRLQAYQEAGADVLYAPGLRSLDDIATVARSVDRPINALAGLPGVPVTVAQLQAAGATRISVGSGLCRVGLGAFLRAAQAILTDGTFGYGDEAANPRMLNDIFAAWRAS
jgi:2-methylisocitrate lyase-like PEP mutase family enzyme